MFQFGGSWSFVYGAKPTKALVAIGLEADFPFLFLMRLHLLHLSNMRKNTFLRKTYLKSPNVLKL